MSQNDRFSINSNQAPEPGIGWDRSDNLNRLLSELFEIASFDDDNRNIPALREDRTLGQIGRRSKSDRTSQSRFSGVYVIVSQRDWLKCILKHLGSMTKKVW